MVSAFYFNLFDRTTSSNSRFTDHKQIHQMAFSPVVCRFITPHSHSELYRNLVLLQSVKRCQAKCLESKVNKDLPNPSRQLPLSFTKKLAKAEACKSLFSRLLILWCSLSNNSFTTRRASHSKCRQMETKAAVSPLLNTNNMVFTSSEITMGLSYYRYQANLLIN